MTIILTKDCLGIIANYLSIKDAIKIALLNKEYNKYGNTLNMNMLLNVRI